MNRPVSGITTAPNRSPILPGLQLRRFDLSIQQYGDYFAGFEWQIFGTCTFKSELVRPTLGLFSKFNDCIGRRISARVAAIAVMERTWSGLGKPGVRPHFHFVMAIAPHLLRKLTLAATDIWQSGYGHIDLRTYDSKRGGTHYIAKTAANPDFDFFMRNTSRIPYNGPADLFENAQTNSVVPAHFKNRVTGSTLVLR